MQPLPVLDAACVDGARFFFGVQQPQGEAVDGLFTLDEMLDPETEAPPEEHAAASVEVIQQGSRNDTLSAYALKVLKAKGADDGTAANYSTPRPRSACRRWTMRR